MIRALAILLVVQLGGETLARGLGLPIPGPVIGLGALFIALLLRPALRAVLEPVTSTLLGHLSLLFVPAGVGVIAHLDTFGRNGPALVTAILVSTTLAILAAAGTFVLVARLMGSTGDE